MSRRALALALVLVLLLQSAGFAAFEENGAGARASGMGEVFTAIADDVYTIHYNPAGLATLDRPEVGSSYNKLLMGLTDGSDLSQTFLGYAHPINGGAKGAAAASWEQFALGSLYKEQAFTGAYAHKIPAKVGPGDLYGGLGVKYLSRSFGSFPEATNAMSGIMATGQADPVLAARSSVGAPDANLGFLYKWQQRYALGLDVDHLAEPNVGFSSADKVARLIRMGFNYHSLISNVGVQYQTQAAPGTGQDNRIAFGAERWFPKLFVGEFGLRGALALGSRNTKEITAGLSYRTQRFGVDYGFGMPIASIQGTSGSHRVALSFRFGSPSEPDESMLMILDAMRALKGGKLPDLQTMGARLNPQQKAVLQEHLGLAKTLENDGHYAQALDEFSKAVAVAPSDADLLKRFGRLNWLAHLINDMGNVQSDTVRSTWHKGNMAYLSGNDAVALDQVAAALSLAPGYKPLEGFLEQLELATGLKRPVIKEPAKNLAVLDALAQAQAALEAGRYEDAIAAAKNALATDPSNAAAWEDIGTATFAVGDYTTSLGAWRRAHQFELDKNKRTMIEGYIASLRKLVAKPHPTAVVPTTAAVKPAKPAGPTVSPQELQKLYDQGVDDYTSGQLEKAREAFKSVLDKDPGYTPAIKALRRVEEELQTR